MSAKYTLLPNDDIEQGPVFDYTSQFQYKDSTTSMSNYKSIFKYKPSSNSDSTYEPYVGRREFGSAAFVMSFTVLSYLFMILTAPVSLWFCIKIIPKHERILIFRLGRVHAIKGPGVVVVLPCIEKWQKVDIRTRAFNIPPQQLITVDGAIVELGADVQFRIVNVMHSVLHVQNLNETFRMLSRNLFLNNLCKKVVSQLQQERPFISQELVDSFNEITWKWGIKVEHVELSHVTVLKKSEPSSLLKNFLSTFQSSPQQSDYSSSDKNQISTPEKTSTIMNMLNSFAKSASGPGFGDTESAIIKLEVLGTTVETFFICFDRSETCVYAEEERACPKPDVTIRIAEKDLINILNQELSPLQAYIGGLIQTEGNIQLLMKFEMAMQSVPKQLPKSTVIDV